jgi:hypothetical protein
VLIRSRPACIAPCVLRPPTGKPMVLCVSAVPSSKARSVSLRIFCVSSVAGSFDKRGLCSHDEVAIDHVSISLCQVRRIQRLSSEFWSFPYERTILEPALG